MKRLISVFFWSTAVLGTLCSATSRAATMYWDTSTAPGIQAGNGTWNNNSAAAWSNDTAGSDPLLPWTSSGDDAYFSPSGTSTIAVASGVGANSLVFDGTGYTLSTNRVTVGAGGIVANESATVHGISLGNTQSVTVADGKTLTIQIDTTVAAGTVWTKDGDGTLAATGRIVVGANSGYTHAAGTLNVAGSYGIYVTGGTAGDAVFTQTGGTINATGAYCIIGGSGGETSGTGNKAVFNMEGGLLNVSNRLYCGWNSDTVINQTGGTIQTTNLDSVTDNGHGWYYLQGGSLIVTGTASLGYKAGLQTDFVQSGGSASFGRLVLGGTGSGGTGNYTINTNDGASTLTVGESGLFVGYSGASTSSLTIDGGTVAVNGNLAIGYGASTTGTVTQTAGTVTIAADHALQFGPGTATYDLDGGTLRLASLTFTDAAKQSFRLGGGTLENNGSGLMTTAIPVELKAGSSTISTPNASDIHLAGPLSGTGSLTKTGAGILTLSGTSTYTGAVTVSGGTLINQTSLGGGATVATGATLTLDDGVIGGSVTASGTITGTGTISGTTNLAAGAVLEPGTSGGALNTGRVNVGTSSTGTATINMSEGTLNVVGYFILGAGNSLNSTGVLNLSGGQINTSATQSYLGWKGNATVNQTGGVLNVTSNSGIHVCTDLSGSTALYNLDGGTLRTPAINTTVGSATNRNILLSFGGGTLENNGTTLMTTAIPVEVKAGGGTISTPTTDAGIHLTGSLTGAGNLTKTGAGTLTLSGVANAFTGTVNVSTGTLVVNNSIAGGSGVNVASGAIVGGSGAVSLIGGAGTVSPGSSDGILTAETIDPDDGLSFALEFGQTGSPDYGNASASGNDVLRLTGTTPSLALLTDSNVVDVYLNVSNLALNDEFRGGAYVDVAGDATSLPDFLTMVEGATYNYYVLGDGGGSHIFGESHYYTLDEFDSFLNVRLSTVAETAAYAGGTVYGGVMQFTVVPEPGAIGLLIAGILGFLAMGGRKRR